MPNSRYPNRRRLLNSVFVVLLIVGATTLVLSWGVTGHRIINLKAVLHLPVEMASLKADSQFYANHASDADNRKVYTDTSFFAEAQRHYIDIDWYPNYHQLPHSLDSVIALYGRATVWDKGTQPWATMMEMDSLTAQFARGNISKAESTMADIGHYVGDAHQPLHCTQNFDGQFTGNGGVHSRYETGMINLYQSALTILQDSARYISSPLDYVFNYIYQSNSYVDSIMAADTYAKTTSGWNGSGSVPSAYYTALWDKVGGFTRQQFQRATVDLASLWYTAWLNSQLPPPVQYDTIFASSVGQGILMPSGAIILQEGRDTTFTFAPAIGSHLDSVQVDGARVDSLSSYTFHNVSAHHSITVWFSVNHYAITASAEAHGAVVPSGVVSVSYGGGQAFSITADPDYLLDSLIVDGVRVDSAASFTFSNVIGDHQLRATFHENSLSLPYTVTDDWNLLSVPLKLNDYSKDAVFPAAVSRPFAYDGNYVATESLKVGFGYWVKFSGTTMWTMDGITLEAESVDVRAGWNLIGSLSHTIVPSSITSNPPGIVTGEFFGFAGSYSPTDSIRPGKAYWVRVSQAGRLFLSTSLSSSASRRIRITAESELPPPPPTREASSIGVPRFFAVERAYPNPFNPATTIQYQLPAESKVTLEIFNIVGQRVATLIDGVESAGYKSAQWNAGDEVSGVYFYRLVASDRTDPQKSFVAVRKLLLLK